MPTILADQNIYRLSEFLPSDIHLITFDPLHGPDRDMLAEVDALFVRTVTCINQQTIGPIPSRLKFIGTASAGIDHVDLEFLSRHSVQLASAAGCNARSVAEYVAVSLLLWAEETGTDYRKLSAGIVGVGHVGSQVDLLLKRIGLKTVLYDPPRAERDKSFSTVKLEEVLSTDIVTLHVPLTSEGQWATSHWLDKDKLQDRTIRLVINAARGGVVDEQALMNACSVGSVQSFILDVWENEPYFSDNAVAKAFIATPHIAGYSEQAKIEATKMIVSQMSDYFDIKDRKNIDKESVALSGDVIEERHSIGEVLRKLHPVMDYDEKLMKLEGLEKEQKGREFQKLRTNIPFRNEFQYLAVPRSIYERHMVLQELGFRCLK